MIHAQEKHTHAFNYNFIGCVGAGVPPASVKKRPIDVRATRFCSNHYKIRTCYAATLLRRCNKVELSEEGTGNGLNESLEGDRPFE